VAVGAGRPDPVDKPSELPPRDLLPGASYRRARLRKGGRMSVMTAAARWFAGKRDLTADVVRLRAELERWEGDPPKSIDPAEHKRWKERRSALQLDLESAEGALTIATAEVAKAEAAQREADADANHASVIKLRDGAIPVVNEVGRLLEKLNAAVLKIEEQRKAVEEANRNRGNRPIIVDAETLARQIPGRTIPEKWREDVNWLDARGEPACVFRTEKSGELVPVDAGYRRTIVRVLESPEERIPPRTPARFAKALKLVDPAGNPLKLD